jgi:hypothetical protein
MTFQQNSPGRCAGAIRKGPIGQPRGPATGVARQGDTRALLARESEALMHKGVEMTLTGDPTALRLRFESVPPAVSGAQRQIHAAADRGRRSERDPRAVVA